MLTASMLTKTRILVKRVGSEVGVRVAVQLDTSTASGTTQRSSAWWGDLPHGWAPVKLIVDQLILLRGLQAQRVTVEKADT
jgi:hypothetical protein